MAKKKETTLDINKIAGWDVLHIDSKMQWDDEQFIQNYMNTYQTAARDRKDERIEQLENDLHKLREDFEWYRHSTSEYIAKMQKHMAYVDRDNALEEDFEELREAWETYNELLEKLRTFKALKDSA